MADDSDPTDLVANDGEREAFEEVLRLVVRHRRAAARAVNQELIDLYSHIGAFLSQKVERDGWGRATVQRLAAWLGTREPSARGFSASNLWRMRQFWETYRDTPDLAPLVREVAWSKNLEILAGCKRHEERAFYLRAAADQGWTKRELNHQIRAALFERVALGQASMSSALRACTPRRWTRSKTPTHSTSSG